MFLFFFFSSRRRHTRSLRDWSSDVCSSDLLAPREAGEQEGRHERRIGQRFVEDGQEIANALEEQLGRDGERPVTRAERTRRDRGVATLVEPRIVEAEGEGGELAVRRAP